MAIMAPIERGILGLVVVVVVVVVLMRSLYGQRWCIGGVCDILVEEKEGFRGDVLAALYQGNENTGRNALYAMVGSLYTSLLSSCSL
jgi:hypothetical protein